MNLYRNIFCQIAPNGDRTQIDIALHYSFGRWQETKPVALALALMQGRNIFRFSLKTPHCGLTIKQLTLTPVR